MFASKLLFDLWKLLRASSVRRPILTIFSQRQARLDRTFSFRRPSLQVKRPQHRPSPGILAGREQTGQSSADINSRLWASSPPSTAIVAKAAPAARPAAASPPIPIKAVPATPLMLPILEERSAMSRLTLPNADPTTVPIVPKWLSTPCRAPPIEAKLFEISLAVCFAVYVAFVIPSWNDAMFTPSSTSKDPRTFAM